MAVGDGRLDVEKAERLRAYIDYFRDVGVYEFYRNDTLEPQPLTIEYASTVETSVEPATIEPEVPVLAATVEFEILPQADHIPSLLSFNDIAPLPQVSIPAADRAAALAALRQDIGDCTRCPLAYAGRHTIVFGDGDPNARLMFVGEGPGADEDEQGLPFVGKSGQLLNNMINAMGLSREQVYIANIVKCRPPANRAPEPAEANICTQFLVRQMDIVQPQVVVALGATAAMYLLGVKQSLASLRGRFHMVRGAKAAITYHPAFLLRDPRQKGEAWKDLQMVMAEMGLKSPSKNA
jgi:uracil-DNA glycosylase family 4